MRFSDTLLGLFLLLGGSAILLHAMGLPQVPGQPYGPGLFPTLVAVGLMVCGSINVVSGLRARAWPLATRAEWVGRPGALTGLLVALASILLYVVLLRPVGFLPVSFAILLVFFRMFSVGWARSVLLSAVSVIAMDYLFRTLLLVPLPFGVVPRLPW